MEQIHEVIRSFAGSSYTKDVLDDIIDFGALMNQHRYLLQGGMIFRVDKICICDDSCGGIRCEPILVLSLMGC